MLSWLGLEREEVLERLLFQDLLGLGEKLYFETHFIPLLKLQGSVKETNLTMQGKGSVKIPVLINAKQVNTEMADQPLYRVSLLDMTKRRQYEQELLSVQKNAEARNKGLKEINEELERFAQTASHDLQAPLNSILTIVDLLKDKDLFEAGSEKEELFSMITICTEQMRTMIRDLLAYSKIEVATENLEEVSLNEVAKEAFSHLQDKIQSHQAEFRIPDLPLVKGVKSLLVRLFQNLFSNALKYRSEATPLITVIWEKARGYCRISITDNGMGFEQEQADQVFGFMQRLSTAQSISGTGVGLSACKRIVEQHGGEIGVNSQPGAGSTFYFTLPVAGD